ncbi:MAG: glutamate racemase [Acidobacteriota bacterium]
MTDGAIGVFDSGIGGLTVYAEIRKRFPRRRILYLGDTARVPYGIKSTHTIIRYSLENASFLMRRGVETIVVACNTSSATALNTLEKQIPVPVIGVIRPGAEAAVRKTRSRRIAVIGTEATVRSNAYLKALRELDRGVKVFSKACPLFVPLVEEGWLDHEVTRRVAEIYLHDLRESRVDTVVLGCTHYPLLKRTIRSVLGGKDEVEIVDSAEAVAEEVCRKVPADNPAERQGTTEFYVTDSADRFRRVAELFLGGLHGAVAEVDLLRD